MTRTPPETITPLRLWRWRRNPLRRHGDLVEAWVVLLTWVLVVLGGALAGYAAASSVDSTLTARRAEVHQVRAVLTGPAPKTPPSGRGYDDDRVWAAVRWTDDKGAVHTDRAKVSPGAAAGSTVTLWSDGTGRTVPPPASLAEALLQTVLTGVLVAQITGTVVWASGRLACGSLVRRRLAEWDEEWERVEPEWRRLSGGRG
ncbi:Rv1733c family protein [Streptomyces sp. NPDC001091]